MGSEMPTRSFPLCHTEAKSRISGSRGPAAGRERRPDSGVGSDAARARYERISAETRALPDFQPEDLERSRRLVDVASPTLATRAFDVVTCVVGLPLPDRLAGAFAAELDQVLALLPSATRVYRVAPSRLHWEVLVVRRPGEPAPRRSVAELAAAVRRAAASAAPFTIDFTGFFVSREGAVCFQGLGAWDPLRGALRAQLPESSADQLVTGHVSAARILDPVGPDAFAALLARRDAADHTAYGHLRVGAVKLVVERRWYMEDRSVVCAAPLGGAAPAAQPTGSL